MVQRDVRRPQPPTVDPTLIGEADRPENDWGEPEPGAVHGVNHTRRGKPAEDRFQGPKTRTATKDHISRRG